MKLSSKFWFLRRTLETLNIEFCKLQNRESAFRDALKKTFYFRVCKTLYIKFEGVFLQKQNFKLNFKTICILYYSLYIYYN